MIVMPPALDLILPPLAVAGVQFLSPHSLLQRLWRLRAVTAEYPVADRIVPAHPLLPVIERRVKTAVRDDSVWRSVPVAVVVVGARGTVTCGGRSGCGR